MSAKRRRLRLMAFLAGTGLAAWGVWANRRLFLVGDVTTGESIAYPHLRSRVYYAVPAAALDAARAAIEGQEGWNVTHMDTENGALDAEAPALLGSRPADVTVYAIDLGRGQTRVTVRARSRTGRGDWGQSARHIQTLQEAMDSRLTGDAAF